MVTADFVLWISRYMCCPNVGLACHRGTIYDTSREIKPVKIRFVDLEKENNNDRRPDEVL